jgi:hypothetical protein
VKKLIVALILIVFCGSVWAAPVFVDAGGTIAIDPTHGADLRVDYTSFVHFGPWDDRNYELTAEDLHFLSVDEAQISDPLPVFFRVAMRKARPDLRTSGPAQYPRSALQMFRQNFGGYLIEGSYYYGATRVGDRYVVDLNVPAVDSAEPDFVDGEVRITSPVGAAETAIKIHPTDPNRVIAGSNGPGSGQKMHYSTDGGSTWTETLLPLGSTCCDPAVDWSSDGTYAYATTLGSCTFSCGIWVYRSDDGGQTWTGLENVTPGDPRREIGNGDKEFIHVDQSSTSAFKDNVYVTWHQGNVLKVAVSSNNGNTFQTFTHPSDSANLGIGSDVTTDDAGNVYHFWPAFNSRTIRLAKSTNGGLTYSAPQVIASTEGSFIFPLPSIETREAFLYVAADVDRSGGPFAGNIYAAWTDNTGPDSGIPSANHGRIQVAVSDDAGATWSVSTPHETADQLTVDRWHPWLGVGPDGTVYTAYYDTRFDGSRSSVDFYYSFSTDAAQTWSTPERLTSAVSPNIADGFEFGDYNGLDIVMNSLITIFTDNRNEGGGSGDSIDAYGVGVTIGSSSVCGNDIIEPGESCDGIDLGGRTCADEGCTGGGTLACNASCTGFDRSACLSCPTCNNNGSCETGEDCNNCPNDCVSGTSSGAVCGNGVCEAGNGEDCVSCAADCNGKQGGKPSTRYCCGDGDGTNPVDCADARCLSGGNTCTTVPVSPGAFCCGDGTCDGDEGCDNCALDCTLSAFEICNNGADDDCANGADCIDPFCSGDPSCNSTCANLGASCVIDSDCCSNKCKGPSGGKTCK